MLKGQNRLMLRPALLTWLAWEAIPRTMVIVKAAFMCPLATELQWRSHVMSGDATRHLSQERC